MNAAQLLLRRLLEKAGGAGETGYVLLIEGEGLASLPAQMSTPEATYGVHRVFSELGLRYLLWKAKGAPLIAVMPEDVARRIQNAPDLLRRACNQRVHALTANDVLEVMLGVRVVGADNENLQKLALANVERVGLEISHRTLPTVVDRRLLTEILVDISAGEEVLTHGPAQLLATWVLQPPRWPESVDQLVRDHLPTQHGDEGRLLAWALAEPDPRLHDLVVYGAVLTVEAPELPKPAWGPLWEAAGKAPIDMDRRMLRRTAERLADETLTLLGDKGGVFLTAADRVGRECLVETQLQTSRVLPLAFSGRCQRLAEQAVAGKAIRAADVEWLAHHRAARINRADLAVIESIARLSRYLDQPPTPNTDLLEQVREYQRTGAFADLAMLQLRRALASSAHYHTQAQAILARCRERRDRQNKQFAASLATGYEAALHREGLTPLHRLWKRTVAPVWQSDPDARLFLIVLDGCSYPVFLELLYALSQDNTFPLGITPDSDGHVQGIPALAPLPTITSHARGAIFLGELPNDPLIADTVFHDQDEAKSDKARFNQNSALGSRSRRLFLKADLADGGQALMATLADDSVSVVSAVFNAVDDQISSSNTGATVKLAPEDIRAFKPALSAAIKAGRRVLITADHGHSPYVDNSLRAGNGKTPRYLTLGKHEAPPEGFTEIDLAGLGGPPERRAFAWRCGVYLGGQQVGFHGGCGLEEVVVPLAWIERDGLQADEPAWWYGRGTLAEVSVETKSIQPALLSFAPAAEVRESLQPRAQLSLFNPADRAGSLPLPPGLLDKLSADEKSALVLLRETGSARTSELAERLKKNPVRLNGLMRSLRRTLHAEGHVLFSDEALNGGETLYRYQQPKEAR